MVSGYGVWGGRGGEYLAGGGVANLCGELGHVNIDAVLNVEPCRGVGPGRSEGDGQAFRPEPARTGQVNRGREGGLEGGTNPQQD